MEQIGVLAFGGLVEMKRDSGKGLALCDYGSTVT